VKLSNIVAAAALALTSSGCATVTRGTTNQVQLISEPAGADVKTSLGQTCTTPCTIEVSRKSEFVAVFSKDGFQDASVPVQTRVAGSGAAGFAGNVILGGVVGMVADAATGATLEHYPNPVSVTLEAVSRSKRAPSRKEKRLPTSMLLDMQAESAGRPS
jgi:hypothetical protein